MASVYTNDLRLEEIGSGEQSGTWGATTNTNLELIAEAFSFGTEAITTNADTHTTTIADGSTDPGRSLYLKYTGTLDSACTITLGPNTVSKVWFIENATSGSQNIIISQGSGANVTIGNGQVKMIYSDGAGSGAAVVDALADLAIPDLFIDDDLTLQSDSSKINFGADSDVTITHDPDDGLVFKSTATGDDNPFLLTLQTGETDIASGDVLGTIAFQAPDEGTGTDAILVAAQVRAISEGDFSSSSNATALYVEAASSAAAGTTTDGSHIILESSGALVFKNKSQTDDTFPLLEMQTGQTDIAANDVLGKIRFRAPNESTGTDANLGAAAIQAISEGDFSSSSNATSLQLMTGASEEATAKVTVLSSGKVTMSNFLSVGHTNAPSYGVDIQTADTTAYGLRIKSTEEGGSALIRLESDQADDNHDYRNIISDSSGNFRIQSYNTGSFVDQFKIDSSGRVTISEVGTDTTISGGQPGLQVTGAAFDSFSSVVRRDNGAFGSGLALVKSRGTTADSFSSSTKLQDNDQIGYVLFIGDDGTDLDTYGATITAQIDGTPASNNMPTELIFSTNAGAATVTERMKIGKSGEVIIGTDVGSYTSSDFNLIVSNADSGTNILLYDDSGAYNSALITYDTNVLSLGINNSNDANSLLGDSAININASGAGVGVAPTAKLQVKGENNSSSTPLGKIANSQLHLDHTTHLNAISQIGFGYTSSTTYSSASIGFISTNQASNGKGDLFFATRDVTSDATPHERMRIGSGGRVSIGTSSPVSPGGHNSRLAVEGTDYHSSTISISANSANSNGAYLMFSKSRGSSLGSTTVVADSDTLGYIGFVAADGVDLAHMAASIYSQVDGSPGNDDTPGKIIFATTADDSASLSNRMYITSAGVKIMNNTTHGNITSGNSSGASFDSAGTIHSSRATTSNSLHWYLYNSNGNVGSISTNGSATQFNTSSDYRLKENVVTDWDATSRLKQLKPSRFNFKADKDTTVDGFLAHEVSSIVPEAINGEKDATKKITGVVLSSTGAVLSDNVKESEWEKGKTTYRDEIQNIDVAQLYPSDSTWVAEKDVPDYQSIDQSKLVPLLVKTIQELEARITALEGA